MFWSFKGYNIGLCFGASRVIILLCVLGLIFTFSERGPTKSSAACENHFFGDADYTWTLLAIVIGHRTTSKKCGPVKDKTFAGFHFAARHGATQLAV